MPNARFKARGHDPKKGPESFMPNEANAHKQFLKDVTNATKKKPIWVSCPAKFHCFSKVLKLMWTEVWKVWFHQTAQLEAAEKSEIQCNKCSCKCLQGYHVFPSWPGRGEIPRFCSLGNWELLEVSKRFSVLSSKPSRPRAQEIEDNVQAMCKPWSWKSRLPCHNQTAVELVAANMRQLFRSYFHYLDGRYAQCTN